MGFVSIHQAIPRDNAEAQHATLFHPNQSIDIHYFAGDRVDRLHIASRTETRGGVHASRDLQSRPTPPANANPRSLPHG